MSKRLWFVFSVAIGAVAQSSESPLTMYDADGGNFNSARSLYSVQRTGGLPSEHGQNIDSPNSPQFTVTPRPAESAPVSVDQLRHPLTGKALRIIEKAQKLIAVRDYVHAREELRKAAQDRAAAPYAHSLLGQEYVRSLEFREAVPELQQALDSLPSNVPDRSNLGYAFLMLGQITNAEKELRRALELQPANPRTHLVMGLLCYTAGSRDAETEEHLEFAARELPAAHLMLAKFYRLIGRPDASAKELRAYEKSPGVVDAAQARGFVEGSSGH